MSYFIFLPYQWLIDDLLNFRDNAAAGYIHILSGTEKSQQISTRLYYLYQDSLISQSIW